MKEYSEPYRYRLLFLALLGLSFALFMMGRLVFLHIFDHDFLNTQGNARSLRTILLESNRGMITDRLGVPLAVSTPVHSIWVNPLETDLSEQKWHDFAKLMKVNKPQLFEKVQKAHQQNKEFIFLARHVNPDLAEKILKMQLKGIHLQQEYRRFYPKGEVTAHVIGFTDIDHKGVEGVELSQNEWLKGNPGRHQVLKDRLGRNVEDIAYLQHPRGGKDLALSIDHRIQFLAYKELSQAVKHHNAKAGSVVILDAKTNEVLALANYPSFNPNQRHQIRDARFRNRAVTDLFEPGSTLKAFSVANILASGRFHSDTIVDTSPGWMKVGHNVVRDLHDYGRMDLATIMQKSSNVGISKLTLSLPEQSLPELLMKVGFGQKTGSGFPGENIGRISQVSSRNPISLATLAFGYGVSVTSMQLAQGYCTLANKGVKRPITFIKGGNDKVQAEQVMEPHVAQTVAHILATVTEKGGGTRAKVNGYVVAGKTGTARKLAQSGGYDENKHISMFAGFAPLENPRLVMVVMIDEPSQGGYYGGEVAAPVFSKVMSESLRLLDVPVSMEPSHSHSPNAPKNQSHPLEKLAPARLILAKHG